jgi:hypothetical protein
MSPAHAESGRIECQQGNYPWYNEEYMKTLLLTKTTMYEDGSQSVDPCVYIDQKIERSDNTYTAIVSLPEWFDVSAVNALTSVEVDLFDADFWHTFAENGSASTTAAYSFHP